MSGGVPMGRSGPLIAMKMAEVAYDSRWQEAAKVVVTLDDLRPWWCLIRNMIELISVRWLDEAGSTRGCIRF
jgi:hypothetical protein